MRALGPGSVSSFLKVILDVFRWVLLIAAGAVFMAMIVVLLLSFKPELLGGAVDFNGMHIKGAWLGPIAAATLLAGDLYLLGALIIVGRLRRIFQTLVMGDPFHPDNVRRLHTIGIALAALELGRYAFTIVERMFAHGLHLTRIPPGGAINLTTWFAVLVIVVLAEVFREGARLRGEAELTI